jgi:hypothetical protein
VVIVGFHFDLVDDFLAVNLVEGLADRSAQVHLFLAGEPDDRQLFGRLSQNVFPQLSTNIK